MMLKLPRAIAGLMRAREAVRKRWAKEAAQSSVNWSPDVVDVRSVDIDKAVQFAQDVQAILTLAEGYDHNEISPTYKIIFATNMIDRLDRLAAVHFKDELVAPLVADRR